MSVNARTRGYITTITIDTEGAEYIAELMEDEVKRTARRGVNGGQGDSGAREIAQKIRAALA